MPQNSKMENSQKYFKAVKFLKEDFLIFVSKNVRYLLEDDFGYDVYSLEKISKDFRETYQKLEADIFSLIYFKVKEKLALAMFGLFFSELLNEDEEEFYKKKINAQNQEELISRIEEETRFLIEDEEDWAKIEPRSIIYEILTVINHHYCLFK